MDIINHLEAYLAELDDISNNEKDFHEASKASNLGRWVQVLIEKINEYEMASDFNKAAIQALKDALSMLNQRTDERKSRGVGCCASFEKNKETI